MPETELALGRPSAARDRLHSLIGQDGTGAERVSACMARVQLALGDAQRAEAILSSLRASHDCLVAVDAWLTSALVASRARADHLALTSLDRALALAERDGIRRPFVIRRGPRLDARLRHRLQLDDGRFIAGLLGDAGPADRPARPRTPPGGAAHRPGADRAEPPGHAADADRDRRPAPHLRQHAEDAHPVVHRKLGVTKRRDAVDRARELGLL
jgi:LuxR family maltose regulon positive regulatory protein